ncbi:MAG TPA: nuclear transport factor 2 family protein [Thermoanaerobaculia bacterium]|nr:nuclear transport factor 2 family protein [Thermoanaerobaculia bacterium]
MSHIDTVREIYAAFGRGDVPAILERLGDDVEWEYGATPTDVPWLQPRRGRAGAAAFFQSLAAIDIETFVLKAIMGDGDTVVGLVDLQATVRSSGKKLREEDEVHLWHFGPDGKVSRFRHRVDTYQHVQALRA